jgi:hypothetical protein
MPTMVTPREDHTATLLSNGKSCSPAVTITTVTF